MMHGGGIARIIADAAGPELNHSCDQIVNEKGPIPNG